MPKPQNQIIDGRKQCTCCKEMLPVELFSKDIYISNGLKSQCKSCDNKRKSLSRKQQKKETQGEVMQEFPIFKFEEKQVRTVMVNNEPYFVAKDITNILGYERGRDAVAQHCKGAVKYGILTNGGNQDMTVIPERDVYRLIMRSNLPAAEKFENWVVSEVLPSIRKNGGYLAPTVDFSDPAVMLNLLENWKADREKLIEANKAIELQKPKVEFYEAVTGSNDTIDMGQVAKVLNMGIGRNKLFELLREKKILRYNNEPVQSYVDRGWFRQVESKYNKPDGSISISLKTVVFQKGLDGIRKLVANNEVNSYND